MYTILVVEDDRNQRLLYEMELADEGYRVVTTPDPEGAIRAMGIEQPDTVVLDLHLGPHSGLDLLSEIRAVDGRIPIIVHSGYAIDQAGPLSDEGVDAYVVKTSDLRHLKRAVSGVLAHRARNAWRAHALDA